MDNKNIQSILRDVLEEQIPSSQIQLWTSVNASLVERKHQVIQQEEKMSATQWVHLQHTAFAILVITVLLTIAFTTPQGRAFAQNILHLFVRADQDRYPLQSWQMTPPAQSSSESPFQLSVQEAESLTSYDVISPVQIPFGMNFMGASYDSKYHIVAQAFGREFIELSLWQQPLEYYRSCGDISNYCDNLMGSNLVGASAYLETVQIGDLTGEYVEGTWKLTDNGPIWESDPYLKTLRWQTDKMAFELIYMGIEFDRDDLVTLAASTR